MIERIASLLRLRCHHRDQCPCWSIDGPAHYWHRHGRYAWSRYQLRY